MIVELYRRFMYGRSADRIGPDIFATHWRLHLQSTMLALCKDKFLSFHATAAFRPGAYAIGCSAISIGRRVAIRPGTMLFAVVPVPPGAGITIEDDVLIGSGVHIYVGNHKFNDPSTPIIDQGHEEFRPVVLRKGCWIGANAIILAGVTVGENAVVGAGAVVARDVAPRTVVAGNPAQAIREIVL